MRRPAMSATTGPMRVKFGQTWPTFANFGQSPNWSNTAILEDTFRAILRCLVAGAAKCDVEATVEYLCATCQQLPITT